MPRTGSSASSKGSNKRERMYEHVRESYRERGRSPAKAKEIAARTVNKQRRQEGETPNRKTQGIGNPNTPLDGRSRDELYNLARERQISGRSRMTKQQLVNALRGR